MTDEATGRWMPRWYAAVLAVLLGLLAVTAGVRAWQLDRVAGAMEGVQAERVADALAAVEASFEALQHRLLAEARAVARQPAVREGLAAAPRDLSAPETERLVRTIARWPAEPRRAVEVYDPTPLLVAWTGQGLPLDDAPSRARFLEGVQTAVVDEGVRQALAVWHPVRAGTQVVGAVRVVEIVGFDAPVQNEFVRDYGLAEAWRTQTGLEVEVMFGPAAVAAPEPLHGRARLLQGLDGDVLGRVVVRPPAADDVLASTRRVYADLLVLWGVLACLWAALGLWGGYRRALRRTRPDDAPGLAAAAWLAAALPAWAGLRYVLLWAEAPARWQGGKAPLAPLFDPTHLASTVAGGVMRSTGDLLITAVFALVAALGVWSGAAQLRQRARRCHEARGWQAADPQPVRFFLAPALAALGVVALTAVLAGAVRHAVLDSTLDYFTRTGLLPERLVLVVFCGLLLLAVAVLLTAVALAWAALAQMVQAGRPGGARGVRAAGLAAAVVGPTAVAYLVTDLHALLPWTVALAMGAAGAGGAGLRLLWREQRMRFFTLRSLVVSTFLLTLLLYPLLFRGMDVQRRQQMMEAAMSFDEGRDPRVLFALEQVLADAAGSDALVDALRGGASTEQLDSLAAELARGTLLTSLGAYDVSLSLLAPDGRPLGRYQDAPPAYARAVFDEADVLDFDILRRMFEERGGAEPLVEQVTGRRERDRFLYKGFTPVLTPAGRTAGWAIARAEPALPLREGAAPFPRVLVPSGFYGSLYEDLSIAAFYDGALVRSVGRQFGRYRLADEVRAALQTQDALWRTETIDERRYLTYYRKDVLGVPPNAAALTPPVSAKVIAVRQGDFTAFDHLYYLLRLTIAGLFLALPLYLAGLWLRRRAGVLPAPRTHFRDKVLNAFFSVSLVAVVAMGFVGLQVVTGENERAIQSWLQQHLERVVETLELEAGADEMPYRVLDRLPIDSLAARVGLDLNLYEGTQLVASSRPQLLRSRLLDERLPAPAFQAFYIDGFRFTHTRERVGTFEYAAGYRALVDEQGRPRYVVSVPTLPEQERIEAERARTVAYLFGALLLLMVVVMLTAALLAGALTRPIGRLREGLEAVARGRFERALPVDTRDEIGELVQTFNQMQEQLAESRRKLAQQERQLAWREMARQVAHEIKNPLTPMQLKVQHLQRAYDRFKAGLEAVADARDRERFDKLLTDTTGTLLEQIDTLKRIADEFHSFARLPQRLLEPLDLNAVLREAVSLMQGESDAEIELDLHAEPLVVEADREELRRTFINLVKNALQAVPAERTPRIEVASEPLPAADGAPAQARATVTDNGSGVPAELQGRIFEPNFSTKTSGTGLGLAIVRKAIEDLDGDVGFATEEGRGTTFWVHLPLLDE